MEAVRYVGAFLVLINTAHLSWSICQDHPVNNNRDACEDRFNVERHEIVGQLTSREQADELCKTYPQYEVCLKDLVKDCVEDQSFLDMQGYDQKSTQIAFKGFCADLDVYMKGVSCYNAAKEHILECFSNHSKGRSEATNEVFFTKDWGKFYDTLCPIMVVGAKCVTDAVSGCPADVRNTMKNIAYALMHGRCKAKKYGNITSEYDSLYGGATSTRFVTSLGLLTLPLAAIVFSKIL